MKKNLVVVPVVVLTSLLLLAGCTTASNERAEPKPTETSTVTETPTAKPEVVPIELTDVEGFPGDAASFVSVGDNDAGNKEIIFKGTADNILTLQKGFEEAGYTWADLSNGTGTNVSAANEELMVIISVKDTETYSYTIVSNQ